MGTEFSVNVIPVFFGDYFFWYQHFTENHNILVGALEHFCFQSVGHVIILTDELHHFSER